MFRYHLEVKHMPLIPKGLRRYTAGVAFLVLIGTSAVPAAAQHPVAPLPAPPAAVSPVAVAADALAKIRIDNFGQVNEHYYRGARPEGGDFRALATLGVKTVIDLAEEGDQSEEANAKAAGMHFVRIPMSTHKAPSVETIAQFLALVTDPVHQPVYVHCIGGRHRTGVMTAIYRMTVDGWNSARAWSEVKQYKYGAEFLHPEFKEFISGYVPTPAPAAEARQR
jgi:protein-tyrosine phosphatase